MKPDIKKGDKYLCIEYYINYEDEIVFYKDMLYESQKDGTLPSSIDKFHGMDDEPDFWEHFVKIESVINTISVTNTKDNINPDHYKQGKVEVIDMIESGTIGISGFEGFCVGNIIKYISRYNNKNGIEDCKKAKWYLEKLIKHLEND